jgi:hypothetical protein
MKGGYSVKVVKGEYWDDNSKYHTFTLEGVDTTEKALEVLYNLGKFLDSERILIDVTDLSINKPLLNGNYNHVSLKKFIKASEDSKDLLCSLTGLYKGKSLLCIGFSGGCVVDGKREYCKFFVQDYNRSMEACEDFLNIFGSLD